MNLDHRIYTKGITIKNAIGILMMTCCFVSCYEPPGPACLSNKDSFIITVDKDGTGGTHPISMGPCDVGFDKSSAVDSLTLMGIGSYTSGSTPYTFIITLSLNNIKSTGEYAFGIDSVQGEPSVVCQYSYQPTFWGGGDSARYSTDQEGGTGMLTIDNLSSDYISGTFHARLFDLSTPSDMIEITSGSFLFSLK